MNSKIFSSIVLGLFLLSSVAQTNSDLTLWYEEPATDWMTEALPLGNGYVGAMFFGGIEEEQIQFSEGSLWAGGPDSNPDYNFGLKEGAASYLPKVRELLADGKIEEADKLAKKQFTGIIDRGDNYNGEFGDYGAQQTMGDLFIKVKNNGETSNYKRSLDISKSIGKVSYTANNTNFKRTFFANYPSNVLVYQFESDTPTDYEIRLESPHNKINDAFVNNTYSFEGQVSDNKMGFETKIEVRNTNGKVTFKDGVILISNSSKFYLVHTSAAAFKLEYPHYKGNNFKEKNTETLKAAKNKTFESLLNEHISDYTNLFNRVQLTLGDNKQNDIPTNKRLKEKYNGKKDLAFEVLYFQYARYLMISGSRPNSMSMHLQGKWNNSTNPPWAADYHSNINLQMIYWPAEITNLSECHEPFLEYIESLVEPGKLASKTFFDTDGWIVNTMCNAFGFTSTGWGIPWGFFPGGAGWFAQHYWDHYDFTKDKVFLEQKAYPLMKEAALFWIDYLTKNEKGYYVSSPSYSPEHGTISSGASMDHQIAWDLLNNCIKAANELGIDDDFVRNAKRIKAKILPPQIGKWGQLQEWAEDIDDPENTHRHVSHLFALHPGNQISVTQTPELAEAAKISLLARGDSGTGWSRAWKLNFWARLQDGEHAYKMLQELMKPVASKNIEMSTGGGTYQNLLCAHPPFQLDGNMGGASGIAEMLVQSHSGNIELLPAIPNAWNNGSVSGLKARGGFEIAMEWNNKIVQKAAIKGEPNSSGKLKINDQTISFTLNKEGLFTYTN